MGSRAVSVQTQHPQARPVTDIPRWVVIAEGQSPRDVALIARLALSKAARAFEVAGFSAHDLHRAEQFVDVLLSNPEPEAETSALRALAAELEFLRLVQRQLATALEVCK
jgi:hypothetical protein